MLDGFLGISVGLLHCLPQVWVQRADLSGDGVGFHRRLHRSTATVAKHEKNFDSENRNAIFKACGDLWCDDIAGHACNKDVPNRLVKNKFYRYARIGTGEDCGKWFLFSYRPLFQDVEVGRERPEARKISARMVYQGSGTGG